MMNPDNIHNGDIAVTKDGTEYRIVDAEYNTVLPSNKIYLELSPIEPVSKDFNGTYGFQYAWVGCIDDLSKSFTKIGEYGLNSDKEKLMEQYEKVARKIDNAFCELNACGNELRELRKMTLELLNKE